MHMLLTHILTLVTTPGSPTSPVNVGGAVNTAIGTGAGSFHPTGTDVLGVGPGLALPLLTGSQYLIPAAVAFAGLHKLLSHQETGGGFLVDMLVKGGGAILMIQLVKGLVGL